MSNDDWTISWLIDVNGILHPTFKKKLAQQLWEKAEKGTKINNFEKYNFQLFLEEKHLNLRKNKNQILFSIEIITPTSFGLPFDVYLNAENIEKEEDIFKKDISELNVEFEWGENFPLEEVKKHIRPYRKDKKSKTGYLFEVHYFYYSFPDIQLKLKLNSGSSFDKKLLEAQLKAFQSLHKEKVNIQSIFVSDLKDNEFVLIFDFGLKVSRTILKKLLNFIDKEFSLDIELIEIE